MGCIFNVLNSTPSLQYPIPEFEFRNNLEQQQKHSSSIPHIPQNHQDNHGFTCRSPRFFFAFCVPQTVCQVLAVDQLHHQDHRRELRCQGEALPRHDPPGLAAGSWPWPRGAVWISCGQLQVVPRKQLETFFFWVYGSISMSMESFVNVSIETGPKKYTPFIFWKNTANVKVTPLISKQLCSTESVQQLSFYRAFGTQEHLSWWKRADGWKQDCWLLDKFCSLGHLHWLTYVNIVDLCRLMLYHFLGTPRFDRELALSPGKLVLFLSPLPLQEQKTSSQSIQKGSIQMIQNTSYKRQQVFDVFLLSFSNLCPFHLTFSSNISALSRCPRSPSPRRHFPVWLQDTKDGAKHLFEEVLTELFAW